MSKRIKEAGPNAQGQLRSNPGWLPLHPDQRRGHEAPGRLPGQAIRYRIIKTPPWPHKNEVRYKKQKAVKKVKKQNDRPLEELYKTTNLRPGRLLPEEHIWKPSDGEHRASHFGAPGHLPSAEQRYPPRHQNYAHYMKQLHEKKVTEELKKAHEHKGGHSHKGSQYLPKPSQNLEKFEKQFRGSGKAHTAPARLLIRR